MRAWEINAAGVDALTLALVCHGSTDSDAGEQLS